MVRSRDTAEDVVTRDGQTECKVPRRRLRRGDRFGFGDKIGRRSGPGRKRKRGKCRYRSFFMISPSRRDGAGLGADVPGRPLLNENTTENINRSSAPDLLWPKFNTREVEFKVKAAAYAAFLGVLGAFHRRVIWCGEEVTFCLDFGTLSQRFELFQCASWGQRWRLDATRQIDNARRPSLAEIESNSKARRI